MEGYFTNFLKMKHLIKQGRHFKSDLLNIATCGIVSVLNHISKKANNTLGFFRRNIKMHSKLLKYFLVCPGYIVLTPVLMPLLFISCIVVTPVLTLTYFDAFFFYTT